MTRSLPVALLAGLASLALSGCTFGCTTDIHYGVEVLIMEPGGPYDAPISIQYRVDGGTWHAIEDTSVLGPQAAGMCTERGRCLLGEELEGTYEVEIRRDIARARFETFVNANACHVQTITVPLSLPAT